LVQVTQKLKKTSLYTIALSLMSIVASAM